MSIRKVVAGLLITAGIAINRGAIRKHEKTQ